MIFIYLQPFFLLLTIKKTNVSNIFFQQCFVTVFVLISVTITFKKNTFLETFKYFNFPWELF